MNSKSLFLCLLLAAVFLTLWQLLAQGTEMPTPGEVAAVSLEFLSDPFYDAGPNDKGIAILVGYSLLRLISGFVLASVVAVILGVILGRSQTLFAAANPYIQILRSISPIAWMPLLLYSVRDSEMTAFFVIFMASLWPTLANTAFGVGNIRKEYLNVASILQMRPSEKFFKVILPAAMPSILSGFITSLRGSFLVLVYAEMYGAEYGMGYYVKKYTEYGLYAEAWCGFVFMVVVLVIVMQFFEKAKNRLLKWTIH